MSSHYDGSGTGEAWKPKCNCGFPGDLQPRRHGFNCPAHPKVIFRGDGRQLAADCLALLCDKPTALAEFCETLGVPVPSPNEED